MARSRMGKKLAPLAEVHLVAQADVRAAGPSTPDAPLGPGWNSDTERRRLRKGHLHDLAMDQTERFLLALKRGRKPGLDAFSEARQIAKDLDPDRLLLKGAQTAIQVNVVLVDEGQHYARTGTVTVELEG